MSTSARRRLMRDFKVCALEMLMFELFVSFLFFFFGVDLVNDAVFSVGKCGQLTLLDTTSVCKPILRPVFLRLL